MNNSNKFVMLFPGRSGGSHLMYTLKMQCSGKIELELLNKMFSSDLFQLYSKYIYDRTKWNDVINQNSEIGTLGLNQLKETRNFYNIIDGVNYDIIGFSTKFRDIIYQEKFFEIISEMGLKVIHNFRNNKIKHLISYYNFYNDLEKGYNCFDESLYINCEQFHMDLKRLEFLDEKLNIYINRYLSNNDIFKVSYEDMYPEYKKTFRCLCDFLNLKYQDTISETPKRTNDDLSKTILNYDEVKDYFSQIGYEKDFEK